MATAPQGRSTPWFGVFHSEEWFMLDGPMSEAEADGRRLERIAEDLRDDSDDDTSWLYEVDAVCPNHWNRAESMGHPCFDGVDDGDDAAENEFSGEVLR